MKRASPYSQCPRRCVIEATIGDLTPYRRGYARTKAGPFFTPSVTDPLIRRGALRFVDRRHNKLTALSKARG